VYALATISPQKIYAAHARIAGQVLRTPLIPLHVKDAPARIFLKLENLQPTGAFKVRGAVNAMRSASEDEIARGVWTASAGNMAQAAAWYARRLGVPCTVVAPETTPITKLEATERLGARIITVPFHEWLEIYRVRSFDGLDGLFLHAFSDPPVMTGNATIAAEILEDLPDVDAVITPYGGGGLSCGVAAAFRHLKPATRCFAAEVATAAPLAASLAAGAMTGVDHTPSFVDGIGAPFLFPEMWDFARQILDGSLVSSLEEIAAAIRLLANHNHVIAEGAGAAPVAAALAGKAGSGTVVCVVSGGNIDADKLSGILQSETDWQTCQKELK
jgi:threonine dehydratase